MKINNVVRRKWLAARCACSLRGVLFCGIALCSMPSASALTLGEAVALAQQNDPTYLAAQANLNIMRERANQAAAGLLPQLTASASTTDNRRDYGVSNRNTLEHYNSHNAQINLTQPLWHAEKFAAKAQAGLIVQQADYQLVAAQQDLLLRLAQAWLEIAQARATVVASISQMNAAQSQWQQVQRGVELGVLPQTELESARAKYDTAIADNAQAENEQSGKLAALERIIGAAHAAISDVSLLDSSALFKGEAALSHWLNLAATSPSVLAAQRAVEAAQEETRKQRAGHQPTLELVGSISKSAQGSGLTGGQSGFRSDMNTLGLQLNLPLFAGGGQNAKVREALAQQDKAEHEREAALRDTQLAIKRAWFSLQASQARLRAEQQAVKSTLLALRAAQSQKQLGIKADTDVLQAQQQYDAALLGSRKASIEALLSWLKLHATTGTLSEIELKKLEGMASSPAEAQPASASFSVVQHTNSTQAGVQSGCHVDEKSACLRLSTQLSAR